jgi:hypothetical protein
LNATVEDVCILSPFFETTYENKEIGKKKTWMAFLKLIPVAQVKSVSASMKAFTGCSFHNSFNTWCWCKHEGCVMKSYDIYMPDGNTLVNLILL